MRKRFIVTESEKESIRNLYEQVAPTAARTVGQQAAAAKPVVPAGKTVAKAAPAAAAPANSLPLAKEILQNIIAGKKMFGAKALPGYVILLQNYENPGACYKQVVLSNGKKRRSIDVQAFQVTKGTVNVIMKDLSIYDESVTQWNANDQAAANITNTDCPDANSYLQYLTKTPPNGRVSKMNMVFENDQIPVMQWWRLVYTCVGLGISVKEMLDILIPYNQNVAKDIVDAWSYQNMNDNSPNNIKLRNQVNSFIPGAAQPTAQPAQAPQQQPVAQQQPGSIKR
jgi:hypothetical protein